MGRIRLKVAYQKFSFEGKEGGFVTRPLLYAPIDENTLIERVADNGGCDAGNVYAALQALAKTVRNFVFNGHAVEIPQLGILRFSLSAKSAETAEQAGAQTVYRRRILFRPSSELKRRVQKVQFETIYPEEEP